MRNNKGVYAEVTCTIISSGDSATLNCDAKGQKYKSLKRRLWMR